ncbi:MAG TPA: glycosyltransferase family 4 protein [Tepidisphaeraceae bacterium]|jgi:predicted O-linked N-acetylglucosamine transferase (SPINDLY family)|nr:glycosyltransferase family 4 protein [Tepidisphaeraceae bacterium]
MASLMELVDRVNKGETVEPAQLEVYQESPNSAEKFLAHHAHAMLDLRQAHQHMLQSLEAIDYSDQKVLNQFVSVSSFLGLADMRAQPTVRFGSSAIARREYALGLEAIASGMAFDLGQNGSYTADRENCQFVATQYARAAQGIDWAAPESIEWNNKLTKIAYIVSGIADDDATGRAVRSFAKHYDTKRFKLQVYVTDAAARREKSALTQATYALPSAKRAKDTLETLAKLKVSAWIAPLDGDLVTASRQLADQLVKDQIDVVIFDTTQADPVAAIVADWDVARVKMNLVRRSPLYAGGIDCVTYVDQNRFELDKTHWNRNSVESNFILEGIDVDDANGPAPQRSAYGIPEQAIVLATAAGDLDNAMSGEFVETVINILRAHPHAIYLLVGDGDLAWQKRKFESAGVGKRVGYAGKRKDLPGFLRIADLYLTEFPAAGATGVLQAMAMERPVVAMRWGDSAEQSQAASFVGSEGTISGRDTAAYIERVSKIIREPAYRAKLGKTMRARVEQHFAFNQTARHIEQLIDQLIQQSSEAEVEISINNDLDDEQENVAEAA